MGSSEIVSANKNLEHLDLEDFKKSHFRNQIPILINLIYKLFTDIDHPLFEQKEKISNLQFKLDIDFDKETKLLEKKIELGNDIFALLESKFRVFCVNPLEPDENKIYMTFDSLKQNFLKVFGHCNDFFLKMFYYLFSKGYDSYKVRLLDWINEI